MPLHKTKTKTKTKTKHPHKHKTFKQKERHVQPKAEADPPGPAVGHPPRLQPKRTVGTWDHYGAGATAPGSEGGARGRTIGGSERALHSGSTRHRTSECPPLGDAF